MNETKKRGRPKKVQPNIDCVCDKCGKQAPIDKEKSTENWIVHKTDKPCSCGGRFALRQTDSERSELAERPEQQIAETVVRTKKKRYVQQMMEEIERNPPVAPSPEFITELFSGAGRPPKYKTKEELEVVIEDYFKSLIVEVKNEMGETEGYKWFGRPTLSGLALWLGMTRENLCNYAKRDEFFQTIKTAKTLVENFNENALHDARIPAGIIFIMKNGFGWRDIQDVRLEPVTPLGDMPDQKMLEERAEAARKEVLGSFTEVEE